MDINYICTKIKDRNPYINGWEDMKRASVIVPIVNVKDKLCILFEVRAKTLRKQPGDVCFPGGKIEVNETAKEAALRETYEELGLKSIDIIKELDVLIKNNGLIIHSFLGEIKDLNELNLSEDEVDSVFYVPIDELLKIRPITVNGKMITEKPEDFPYELVVGGKDYKFSEGLYKAVFYKFEDKVIWGITASILQNFLNIVRN